MYSCVPAALQVVRLEQHAPAESLVPFDVPGDRFGVRKSGAGTFTSVTGGTERRHRRVRIV